VRVVVGREQGEELKTGTLIRVKQDYKNLFITLFWDGVVKDYVGKNEVMMTLDSSDKDYHEVVTKGGVRGFVVKGYVESVE
jgi:hypothetical protein